ncbi:hypothetical protein ON010_g3364 [Phytophthora cinnamomi]|nr:hypothetical protein ON010_g3364 [Phytophthora cinnamomi]
MSTNDPERVSVCGVIEADLKARPSNLAQLSDFISDHSSGNAVIVVGDTNTRYTLEKDSIREFTESQRLTDAWVQHVCNGTPPDKGSGCNIATMTNKCEYVDKIMFRGIKYINLEFVNWNNENAVFLGTNGSPLSDHPPIASTFSWTLNPDVRFGKTAGGPHGMRISDIGSLVAGQDIGSITLRFGERCHGIELQVSSLTEQTFAHDGSGGHVATLALGPGECITPMEAHWWKRKEATRGFSISVLKQVQEEECPVDPRQMIR